MCVHEKKITFAIDSMYSSNFPSPSNVQELAGGMCARDDESL